MVKIGSSGSLMGVRWGRSGTICEVVHRFNRHSHRLGEILAIFSASEIQAINLTVVSPLVKRSGGLIVLQPFEDGAIDNDFVVLNFPTHHAESVVDRVMIDVDFGKSLRGSRRNPLFLLIVIKHDGSASGGDRVLRHLRETGEEEDEEGGRG